MIPSRDQRPAAVVGRAVYGMRCVAASISVCLLGCLLCSCISLSADPRAVVYRNVDAPSVTTLSCADAGRALQGALTGEIAKTLDRQSVRLMTWNIHKEGDRGWQRDLSALAAGADIVLLQETVLQPPLRMALEDAGFSWVMASSFVYESDDVGVLTATRVLPLASCTQRATEPLLRIPKSAVISWLPLAQTTADEQSGARSSLAVVNLHSINFDLGTDAYRAQLGGLADALAGHRGPIIFAGDFNTWNDARDDVVAETATRLGLTEIRLQVDQRAVFLGRHLDHIFVRGLQLVDVAAIPVSSSDHNPVMATLLIP